jgi:SpoVK/Ycf46/Vps4 family AAA+-type ATPase
LQRAQQLARHCVQLGEALYHAQSRRLGRLYDLAAEVLANRLRLDLWRIDLSAVVSKYIGETERNLRAALRQGDAMSPCVLWIDEIEKGLAGASSSGQTDSGVTARVFGSLLTWLNDHDSDVFFVGTCNDASKLPPEFARAERFDGVFFLDLPAKNQREAIWDIYLGHYELDAKQARPDDTNWTGAEIKSCCRLASLLDVPLVQAAQNVVPVAVTAGDKIEYLDLRFLINLTVSICSPTEERAKTLFKAVKAAGATTVAATHAKAVLWAFQADGWAIIWRKP